MIATTDRSRGRDTKVVIAALVRRSLFLGYNRVVIRLAPQYSDPCVFVLKALPAGVAGVSTPATAVIGIVSAAPQPGERVSPGEAMGMTCILAALLALVMPGLPRKRRQSE